MWCLHAVPLVALISLSGCQPIYLSGGDAEAGRAAFQKLGCHSCHRVEGESFPEPVAQPPVPVTLGTRQDPKTRKYLAESILAPSHRFARPRVFTPSDPPLLLEETEYENIREGSESRMGDYNDTLTVRQWLDLVAFLEAVQSSPLGKGPTY